MFIGLAHCGGVLSVVDRGGEERALVRAVANS